MMELENFTRSLATWVKAAAILAGIVAFVLAWAYLVTAFLRAPRDPEEHDRDQP